MEKPDENEYSSDNEQLKDDKKERKADEDHGRSSNSEQRTEQKTERKQNEDKHRTSSLPVLSEDEDDRTPVSKGSRSSRFIADRKRVLNRYRSSGYSHGALRERLGEELASSSFMSRKRQGRSMQEAVDEGESDDASDPEEAEYPGRKRRLRSAKSDEDVNEDPKRKKAKGGPTGECNCGKVCRCKMCNCGKGMVPKKKQTIRQE